MASAHLPDRALGQAGFQKLLRGQPPQGHPAKWREDALCLCDSCWEEQASQSATWPLKAAPGFLFAG